MQAGPSSISVANMKRIALFVQFGGSKISKLGHVTPATPTWGRFMVLTQGGSVLYVCTKFEADSSFRSKLLGVPNFAPPQTPFLMARDAQNLISWRLSLPKRSRPIRGRFMVLTQGSSVLYVCTKFEVDKLFSFKSY